MGLTLVGEQRLFALPQLIKQPAVGVIQALMQLIGEAARLLQGGRYQRRQGGPELGTVFGSGFELGNHDQGGWHLHLLAKTRVSMPAARGAKHSRSRKTLLR
ncbi:hypothetical protein D3C72_2223910 [compost metagenome]